MRNAKMISVKKQTFLMAFLLVASGLFAGCDYRFFDLAEYPELRGAVGNNSFKTAPTEASFESIYKTVITQNSCLNCHKPGEKAEDVPLDTYQDLIGANGNDPLVVPGNLEESKFYQVLLPTAKRLMPPKKSGLPPVEADRVEVIRQWILSGAPEVAVTPETPTTN